jgi:dethiobiotin synthetase
MKVVSPILFITGTDTDVGKSVLASALVTALRRAGVNAAGLKPICSGNRADARLLRAASNNALSLEEINPWHFRTPVAPTIAARLERQRLRMSEVLDHVRSIAERFDVLVVEGAGGLLSPLGEGFDSRDLIQALRAMPVVVCPNKLGAINQSLLVMESLPDKPARRAKVVLMSPRYANRCSQSNLEFLRKKLGPHRVCVFPWLKRPDAPGRALGRDHLVDGPSITQRARIAGCLRSVWIGVHPW